MILRNIRSAKKAITLSVVDPNLRLHTLIMPGQPKHTDTHTATVIHSGSPNPPEIRITGTLRQAKHGAVASFIRGYGLTSGEIIILDGSGKLISRRRLSDSRWQDL